MRRGSDMLRVLPRRLLVAIGTGLQFVAMVPGRLRGGGASPTCGGGPLRPHCRQRLWWTRLALCWWAGIRSAPRG
jgi:hypothetical protein